VEKPLQACEIFVPAVANVLFIKRLLKTDARDSGNAFLTRSQESIATKAPLGAEPMTGLKL
jgi:hypothetical protein